MENLDDFLFKEELLANDDRILNGNKGTLHLVDIFYNSFILFSSLPPILDRRICFKLSHHII
jgi:hypothetical protein